MIDERNVEQFELYALEVLSKAGIKDLQAYGREEGVAWATAKKKGEVIQEIIAIFTGKLAPVPVSNQGAPVKNNHYDPKIKEQMDALRAQYLAKESEIPPLPSFVSKREELVFESPVQAELDRQNPYKNNVYRGQLTVIGGVYYLLPLRCIENGQRIVLSEKLFMEYDLQEGDIVSCFAEMSTSVLVVTQVLTVNGRDVKERVRNDFNDAVYATEPIPFYHQDRANSVVCKYLEWLSPVCKGQRGCLIAPPKAGKTQFLREIAKSAIELNPRLNVFVLLVGQPVEEVSAFRKIVGEENFIYSTYDDEPERQVFTADFIMNRAIAYAQNNADVLLLIDSFTTLARAYNDTEQSIGGRTLAGGLESKTLQYLKKYLGKARKLQQGGSLTILGTVSENTGNPMDELIANELLSVANLEIRLSDALASKRIYPALECKDGYAVDNERITLQGEKLVHALSASKTKEEFFQKN